jgi:subtilisin family serine protease
VKKLFFALFIILVFLNAAFQLETIEARRSRPEVWILGRPSKKPPWAPGPTDVEEQVIPWGINRTYAPDAWLTSTGIGVQIAVLDTGVDKDHEDLYVNIVWGISVVGDEESTLYRDWRDKNGHGTHVTGTIAAMYNDVGVVGVAYNISIYAIKVLSDGGTGTWEDLAEGIWWAIKGPDGVIDSDGDGVVAGDPDDDAAEVISMSLGGTGYSKAVYEAIVAAYNYGIVLVAAAGNEGDDGVLYPAKFGEVIAVAAIDENDQVPSWSSRGPEVELAAPGVGILSTVPRDKYEKYSGTSMACPHVSGTVGLMISKILTDERTYTVEGIRDILKTTADDIGPEGKDDASGYGVVRADKAVTAA